MSAPNRVQLLDKNDNNYTPLTSRDSLYYIDSSDNKKKKLPILSSIKFIDSSSLGAGVVDSDTLLVTIGNMVGNQDQGVKYSDAEDGSDTSIAALYRVPVSELLSHSNTLKTTISNLVEDGNLNVPFYMQSSDAFTPVAANAGGTFKSKHFYGYINSSKSESHIIINTGTADLPQVDTDGTAVISGTPPYETNINIQNIADAITSKSGNFVHSSILFANALHQSSKLAMLSFKIGTDATNSGVYFNGLKLAFNTDLSTKLSNSDVSTDSNLTWSSSTKKMSVKSSLSDINSIKVASTSSIHSDSSNYVYKCDGSYLNISTLKSSIAPNLNFSAPLSSSTNSGATTVSLNIDTSSDDLSIEASTGKLTFKSSNYIKSGSSNYNMINATGFFNNAIRFYPSAHLELTPTSNGYSRIAFMDSSTIPNTAKAYIQWNPGDASTLLIHTDHLAITGDASARAFFATSDERKKENITKLEGTDNIPEVYEFTWKNDPSSNKNYGFIAQELLETYPELVNTTDPESYNINIVSTLALTIGKLNNKIKQLEARIEALENK